MATRHVKAGTAETNTVQLLPQFAQVDTWCVDDYEKEGFTFISATIEGTGPIPGEKKTTTKLPSQEFRRRLRNGKVGTIAFDWKRLNQDKLSGTRFFANEVDAAMAAMKTHYVPRITFNVLHVTIKDAKGRVISLVAYDRGPKRRLYVEAIDGVTHTAYDVEQIESILHNLVERRCHMVRGSHSNPVICEL